MIMDEETFEELLVELIETLEDLLVELEQDADQMVLTVEAASPDDTIH
jgi:hypothetical protein